MNPRKICLAILIAAICALIGSPILASSITYSLFPGAGPGTFKLTAQTSAGDNFGLVQYAVELKGFATLEHTNVTPRGADAGSGFGVGFTFAVSSNADPVVSAAQDVINPGNILVYGMGQTAGTLASHVSPPSNFVGGKPDALGSYGVPVVLATGTYGATIPRIDRIDGLVFTNMQGRFEKPTSFVIRQLPEPASFSMLGLAAAALCCSCRVRRN